MARVLLIDDDEANLDFMRQVMRIDRHELVWAADGAQGLDLMRRCHPDLIICDVVMPHLGGYAVLETVRGDPAYAKLPILLFSAAMTDEGRALALRRGASEVLAKPFDLEQLRAAIRRCLAQEQKA